MLPGTEVLTGRITRIDHAARRACFQPQDGTAYSLSYDILVLVPGSVSRTLPIPGLAENAVGFRTWPRQYTYATTCSHNSITPRRSRNRSSGGER